jgi:polyphosphate kinase 2 (PPK2 family)
MLETIDLTKKLSRAEFDKALPRLQRHLYDLEKTCWDEKIASIIVFEGWDAAGKGSAIAALTSRLDARGFKLHSMTPPNALEAQRPWLGRFWLRLPNYGEMAIFDRSWYSRVLEDRVEGKVRGNELRTAYRDIADFERMLADDGTVIIKVWLHISKKEQKQRFKEIEKDPLESWRITKQDWKRHEKYRKYLVAVEEMLEQTDSEYGPWTIVEATSRWYARDKIFRTISSALEARLGPKAAVLPVASADSKDAHLRKTMADAEKRLRRAK